MSVEENKQIIRRHIDEMWNKGNTDVLDETFAPDFSVGGVTPEQMKQYAMEYRKTVVDFKLIINDVIAEGDKVVTRYTMSGTNTGPTFNPALGGWNPPTGKPFICTGITINELVNGKIVSDVNETNWMAMLIEMGVNPMEKP